MIGSLPSAATPLRAPPLDHPAGRNRNMQCTLTRRRGGPSAASFLASKQLAKQVAKKVKHSPRLETRMGAKLQPARFVSENGRHTPTIDTRPRANNHWAAIECLLPLVALSLSLEQQTTLFLGPSSSSGARLSARRRTAANGTRDPTHCLPRVAAACKPQVQAASASQLRNQFSIGFV